jgi:hypothetical protein
MARKRRRAKKPSSKPLKSNTPIRRWVFPEPPETPPIFRWLAEQVPGERPDPLPPRKLDDPELDEIFRRVGIDFAKTRQRIRELEAKALARLRAQRRK